MLCFDHFQNDFSVFKESVGCGHGDESVNLRGTVCWVILKAVKFKIHGKKIIFLKYYFNFIL